MPKEEQRAETPVEPGQMVKTPEGPGQVTAYAQLPGDWRVCVELEDGGRWIGSSLQVSTAGDPQPREGS